jgi:hypothetical protein
MLNKPVTLGGAVHFEIFTGVCIKIGPDTGKKIGSNQATCVSQAADQGHLAHHAFDPAIQSSDNNDMPAAIA